MVSPAPVKLCWMGFVPGAGTPLTRNSVELGGTVPSVRELSVLMRASSRSNDDVLSVTGSVTTLPATPLSTRPRAVVAVPYQLAICRPAVSETCSRHIFEAPLVPFALAFTELSPPLVGQLGH